MPRALRGLMQLLEEGRDEAPKEYRLRARDGREVWVEESSVRIDRDGRPVSIIGIARDITERKRTERALARAERRLRLSQKMEAIGRLASGVAHGFTNAVGVLQGFIDLMRLDLPADDPLRPDLDEMARAAGRATALTRQLLDISRRPVIEPRVVDLGDLVEGSLQVVEQLMGEDVRVAVTRAGGPFPVLADPAQLEQALLNIAINAREAMPDGGELAIFVSCIEAAESERPDVELAGPICALEIRDTGLGMDREQIDLAFEPFYTTKDDATGLGLSTAYAIVHGAGGRIQVHSTPGKGTRVELFLPAARGAPERRDRDEPMRPATAADAGEILVAEDDPVLRNLAGRILRRTGYEVVEAADGDEAFDVFARDPARFDLVLTDVVMPGTGGVELAARVARIRPETRFLFMSGYTDETLSHHGLRPGSARVILKPFSAAALAAKVGEVLAAEPEPG